MTFRIGIISDTHGLLRPEAERRLAGVDHIIHGGDIGRREIMLAVFVVDTNDKPLTTPVK